MRPPATEARRVRHIAGALTACAPLLAGCGGATHTGSTSSTSSTVSATTSASQTVAPASVAQRVCDGARAAATAAGARPVRVDVVGRRQMEVRCRMSVADGHLLVVANWYPQAWAQFDDVSSHQQQIYGNSGAYDPRELGVAVAIRRGVAAWIPERRELFATNGSQTGGGSFVTVTVSGRVPGDDHGRRLARAVTLRALRDSPRGPA